VTSPTTAGNTQAETASNNNEVAQNTAPANAAPAPASDHTNTNELPQTAGNSGMLMLGGLLALGGAFSVRFARGRA
jgi:LPXTG-motif cell wall-anchored protein